MGSIHALQYACGGELTFVFRHFPLEEIHAHAHAWAMHEYLFEHQHALEDADLRQYARHFVLDPDRFEWIERRLRQQSGSPAISERRTQQRGGHRYVLRERVRHDSPFDVASLRAVVPAHRLS